MRATRATRVAASHGSKVHSVGGHEARYYEQGSADMNPEKRAQNARKFGTWDDLPKGGRRYWFEVKGRSGWCARYVKEVDSN